MDLQYQDLWNGLKRVISANGLQIGDCAEDNAPNRMKTETNKIKYKLTCTHRGIATNLLVMLSLLRAKLKTQNGKSN